MAKKISSKQKESEFKSVLNKSDTIANFEYKGPDPEGPRPNKYRGPDPEGPRPKKKTN